MRGWWPLQRVLLASTYTSRHRSRAVENISDPDSGFVPLLDVFVRTQQTGRLLIDGSLSPSLGGLTLPLPPSVQPTTPRRLSISDATHRGNCWKQNSWNRLDFKKMLQYKVKVEGKEGGALPETRCRGLPWSLLSAWSVCAYVHVHEYLVV